MPAGEFRMGSTSSEADDDERPVTQVRISRGFWLGKYELTQGQWQAVMRNNPSRFDECGPKCPVEEVSWDDVQEFIGRLNGRAGGNRYRLPTEAEWEYAARAGTDTPAGDLDIRGANNAPVLDRIAWYGGNSGVRYEGGHDCSSWKKRQYKSKRCGTHPVGQKAPNAWGLYDMLGNVWELVGDWYGGYPGGAGDGPAGARLWLAPGVSGRQLDRRRRGLPGDGSRHQPARHPRRQPRLPPAEDRITLCTFTLLPYAKRRKRGREAASAGAERRTGIENGREANQVGPQSWLSRSEAPTPRSGLLDGLGRAI